MMKLFQTINISYYISCYFAVTAIIGCLKILGFDWIWNLYAIFNLCIVIFVYRYLHLMEPTVYRSMNNIH